MKHTAERVCGRNAPKVKRGVDDWHEKVGGANDGEIVAEAVNGRIVVCVPPDEQIFPQKMRTIGQLEEMWFCLVGGMVTPRGR